MPPFILKNKVNILLFVTYLVIVSLLRYCYPNVQISWDASYYIEHSKLLDAGIRPIGYSVFLKILHRIPYLSFVADVQFLLYFFAIAYLIAVIRAYYPIGNTAAYFLGLFMLAEPAALYYCFNILSDILFTFFSLIYLATLLQYVFTKKWGYMLLHLLMIFCCLETRLIALFYPVFSFAALVLYLRPARLILINGILLFLTFYADHKININRNAAGCDRPIHSPFTGWTYANNALYALPYAHIDPQTIKDPDVRRLQIFFTQFFDTSSYKLTIVNTDYIWERRSPLRIFEKHIEDSLRKIDPTKPRSLGSMFLMAPMYDKYGTYIETHYPLAFIRGYILPNFETTFLTPHDGEMVSYYYGPKPSPIVFERYRIKPADLYCRIDLYKNCINRINLKYYQLRLLLFTISIVLLITFRKKIAPALRKMLTVIILFVLLFYAAMLCSSWFMPRYLLPILPLITFVIIMGNAAIVKAYLPRKPKR